MRLTGRTILITGGSAGIGLAFALKFLGLGNEVIEEVLYQCLNPDPTRRPTAADVHKALTGETIHLPEIRPDDDDRKRREREDENRASLGRPHRRDTRSSAWRASVSKGSPATAS